MSTPILATKLYIPPPPPKVVSRPRLVERLNEGVQRKLTLISAPAGFGKTTLLSEWVASQSTEYRAPSTELTPSESTRYSVLGARYSKVAWLSLDEGDNDPARFLTYLIAALRSVGANVGESVLGVLQSPQPPATEAILTGLLNEITAISDDFVLVLDDYHAIDSKSVDDAWSSPPVRILSYPLHGCAAATSLPSCALPTCVSPPPRLPASSTRRWV
jgi:LuxR family transcriptional regulator, maltose regulon positive regulatory protein